VKIRFVPLIGLVFLACTEETTQPVAGEFPPLSEGAVRVNIVAQPLVDGITVTELMIDAESLELGAYQGRFRFDPEALELIDVTLPEGDFRFVNTNGASDGEIRFAGFTVSAFESPVALQLRFRNKRELRLEDLSAELEVVGDVMGVEVRRENIMEPAKLIARLER
jgi:hypothetical protein